MAEKIHIQDKIVMFTSEQIEQLKQYFQAKAELVTKLPSANEVTDFQEVVLKTGNIYTVYQMISGQWKLKSTLS